MAETPHERRTWIDRVVAIAPYFGLKPIRVRWKLENWSKRRAEAGRRREQRIAHIRYQHKTCAACGAVQDRDAAACSRCGSRLGRRWVQVLARLGIFAPQVVSMSSVVGLALVLVYVRLLVAAPGSFLGMEFDVLIRHGGHYPPAIEQGQLWRWLTACFLHAGVLHLGFNLFALAVVGPQIEALYGRFAMLGFFVVTGILASIGSGLAGLHGVGIGASGAIMGLVGAAAGSGQREGTAAGRQLRNDMLKWSVYVILFGVIIRADNAAHIAGLIAGFALGFAIRPRTWRAPRLAPVRAIAAVLATAASIAAIFLIASPPG